MNSFRLDRPERHFLAALVLFLASACGAEAVIPGAHNPDAFTKNNYCKRALDYCDRCTRAAYLKVGKQSPAWDADVIKFFDASGRWEAYRNLPYGWRHPGPSLPELRAMAAVLRQKGCDDPLVFFLSARTLERRQWNAGLSKTAQQMLEEMQRRRYPPLQIARAVNILTTFDHRAIGDMIKVLGDSLVEALCAKEYPGIDRRFVLSDVRQYLTFYPGVRDQVAGQLRSRKDADPWLMHAILGELEIASARGAENPGALAHLSGSLPKDPKPHWEAARRHLVEAWKLHPDYPEPAVQMMRLAAAGGGTAEDTVRLWFERAVAAQLDWTDAYTEMRQFLVDRGDVDAMYGFGVECLRTARYDTDVPWRFIVVLSDIEQVTRSDEYWRRPGVYEKICEFFQNNARDAALKDMVAMTSRKAFFAYRTDHFEDARKALDQLGDRADRALFQQHAIDPEWAISRTYALTGALKARTQAMETAAAAGQKGNAAEACRQMLAGPGADDKARPYLRHRAVALEIESTFAAGGWVPIQPDADLAGWTAAHGQWSVDGRGGLVGKLDPRKHDSRDLRGPMLLCQAKIGTRFEVGGHAEVIEPKEEGRGFGVVISYYDPKIYWECFFNPPHGSWGNDATVICSVHHNPHQRRAKVTRSEDFRVQVYDGRVATLVGAEIQRPQVPFVVDLDHDAPSDDSPFGVGAARGMFNAPPVAVRFTNLKIRKMKAPPAQMKVPEPE